MTVYYKYYLEAKNRVFLLLLNWISLLTICYCFKETLLFFFTQTNKHSYFIFTNVTEIFYVYLKLIFFTTNQISSLILIYHIVMFLALSLYKSELLKLKFILKVFILTWLFSIIFLIKTVLPISWSFFLSFQANLTLTQQTSFVFEAKIEEYFQFFVNLYYTCLFSCQFSIFLIFFLTRFTKKIEKVKTFRKLFYLIFIIFSTLVTPPDVISQIGISSFLMIICEFLIFVKCLKLER